MAKTRHHTYRLRLLTFPDHTGYLAKLYKLRHDFEVNKIGRHVGR